MWAEQIGSVAGKDFRNGTPAKLPRTACGIKRDVIGGGVVESAKMGFSILGQKVWGEKV